MSLDRLSLSGSTALVTGASSGLGWHFAKVLSKAGASVVVTARRKERLEALVREIEVAGGRALAIVMDVTDNESVVKAFDLAESTYGVVDVLVNNAGIGDPRKFLDISESAWDSMMDINLKSAWRIGQEASQRLVRAEKPGSIINIASILGLRVGSQLSHYAVAKAGVVQLTRAMALELARYGIRVNSIAPGYFCTEMNQDFFATSQGKNYINQTVPMGRLGDVEELSGPLLLLASQAGSFMTGTVINVDGGHLNNAL
jgi:NAD(P)-dependent dehydrogenase (short-subunit alcohol dehydrogenase family)